MKTEAPTFISAAVFRKEIRNRFVRSFLAYIPYAVLGAMTFPDVLYSTGDIRTAACGAAVAVLLAWRGRSLLTVAVAAHASIAGPKESKGPLAQWFDVRLEAKRNSARCIGM